MASCLSTMDDTNLKIYDAELVETNKINEPGTIIETTKSHYCCYK